jgi:asparagine synthase (glutamine-hydrolysing)
LPGIAGICITQAGPEQLERELGGMLRTMLRGASAAPQGARMAEGVALGWFGRAEWDSPVQSAVVGGSTIVFDGEIYGRDLASPAPCAIGRGRGLRSNALRLLQGYLDEGESYLAGLEGRFVAAIWDAQRRTCLLVNDKFGTKPLYFHHDGARLALASEIKGLLALPWVSREVNPRGLVEFFAYGHLWNRDTLFASIECLDAATVAYFDLDRASIRLQRYWRPNATKQRSVAESLDATDAALKVAVDDRSLRAEHLGISLSGGMDARTLLGVMDRAGPRPVCVSLGMEGSLDQISARQLAELAGCAYHPLVLDQGFLADFEQHLDDMVELTDGHYLSQCIVMPTLPLYAKLGIRNLLRGHAGELVHMHKAYNFSVDRSLPSSASGRALHDWLFARLQSHLTAGVDEPLIGGVTPGEFTATANDVLTEALADTAHGDHPLDRVSQLFLDQRTRRETAMSLVKFNSVVDLQVPYLDGRFVEATFATPPELRLGEAIQTNMLTRRRPEFLKPANANTGAPVGAGALRRQWCYLRMKVLAKLGVRGYQPYERLGLWLRRELKPVVEKTLLAPACLDRGLLEPDAVRHVVQRHFSGERNHTFLLMAMMILERGVGRLLDRGPLASSDGPANRRAPQRPALAPEGAATSA